MSANQQTYNIMSKNYNRAKFNKAQNGNEHRKMFLKWVYPPYWDDGIMTYPKFKKGFKNPNKRLLSYQVRMYKTWKHNRKNRWK